MRSEPMAHCHSVSNVTTTWTLPAAESDMYLPFLKDRYRKITHKLSKTLSTNSGCAVLFNFTE